MKRVMVQLTEEQDAWLAQEAQRRSTSKAHVVRLLVNGEKSPLGSNIRPDLPDPHQTVQVPAGEKPPMHVHDFEFHRKREGKPGTPNSLYACACGAQEWRSK